MQMAHWRLILLAFILAVAPAGALAQKIAKETIVSEGKKRTYYLYVPKSVQPSSPVPLVVLLHGSNHVGLSLAEKWDKVGGKGRRHYCCARLGGLLILVSAWRWSSVSP